MHSIWDADSFLDRAQEFVKKAIDEHAEYNTVELDRNRLVKKGAVTRRRFSEQVAVNTHTKGHKLRRKGKRRAADGRGADWKGGGRHGGI